MLNALFSNPYMMIFAISMLFGLLGMFVSSRLKSKFDKYSRVPLPSGQSGAEVARQMLNDKGIDDVVVQSVPGKLTDHYNPANRTVNLSPEVFQGRSVAAAAVAAHECGHAIQHATAYPFLGMRSKLVPMVQVSSKLMRYVMMAAMFGLFATSFGGYLIWAAVIMQGTLMLFALVTLPVEFDASKRAMVYLDESGIAGHRGETYAGAKDALKWAGMTYFVAALASVAQFLYLLALVMGRR